MKKRIFTIFALMLVVAMMATALVGCSFFRENDYRVANETYVTVKHPNGVTLNISYNEILDFTATFNTTAYQLAKLLTFALKVKSKAPTFLQMQWAP